jgi:hypothetical protein
MGELAKFRMFTSGLGRLTGWHHTAVRAAAAVVLLLIVAAIVAGIVSAAG